MSSLYFAPVQGHTDAAYRHYHALNYSTNSSDRPIYFTPFIRLEKNGIRQRDIRDLTSELNKNTHLVPQIIFRDEKELTSLVDKFKQTGITEIDLNMGCPFPLQTGHGRGAATILNKELGESVVKTVSENPDINFSVKMRLGLNQPDEWKNLLPLLNKINLDHITLHPRIAKQQYGGEINIDEFKDFLANSKNPVIYNGDVKHPEQYYSIIKTFPEIKGIMIARGALGRPSIFCEVRENTEWDKNKRIDKMLEFHQQLFNHYSEVLCGDAQIISKIQPFWEYSEEEIGRKAWKNIKKATNLAKYQTAIASI